MKNNDQIHNTYQITICKGCANKENCPNSLGLEKDFIPQIKETILRSNWPNFLKKHIKLPPKSHQKFKINIAACPNACSKPQIVSFGLIRAIKPMLVKQKCTKCKTCLTICEEKAISFANKYPTFNLQKCLGCGKCVLNCEHQAIETKQDGFRVFIGGQLGRHPRLAYKLPHIYSSQEVLILLERCLKLYQTHYLKVKRFGDLFQDKNQINKLLCQESG